jgi:hypothetical protein
MIEFGRSLMKAFCWLMAFRAKFFGLLIKLLFYERVATLNEVLNLNFGVKIILKIMCLCLMIFAPISHGIKIIDLFLLI